MAKKKEGLNDQQIRFCQLYSIHHNGAKAVRESGYSSKRPDQYAYELLSKPEIKNYIRILEEEAGFNLAITKENIMKHMANVAFSSGKGMTKIMALKYLGDSFGAFDKPEESGEDAAGDLESSEKDLLSAVESVEEN